MDEAATVSIEALKRIREEEAEKNTRHRKLKREKVERGEGAALLEDILGFLPRFIVYPSVHAQIAHVLWIAHAHLMPAWESTPRLAFLSPEPASGKTRSMEATELLVPNAVAAVNVTPAYLFRKVGGDDGPPTVLFDEIDTVFGPKAKEHEEIRALLNSGHRRGAVAGRCLVRGKIVETEEISSYAAVALAGLGWLPDTILSRSVIIRMRRRAPDEKIEAFRRRVHAPQGEALCRRLAGWAATILDEATKARPDMPAGVEDRNADMWEPLLAVADIAGGSWPSRARAAAVALVAVGHEVEPSLNIRLLADVRTLFGDEKQLPTKEILAQLRLIEDAPWNDLKGKPITNNQLARRLGQYGVKPKTLRLADNQFAKGYARADLHDVWRRYLPPLPDKAVTAVTPVTHPVSCRLDVTPVPAGGSNVTPPEANRVTPVTAQLTACDTLAHQRNAQEVAAVTPVTAVTASSRNGEDPGDIPEFPRRSPRKPTPTGPDSNSARTQPANWDDPGLPRRALVRLANSYKERGEGDIPEFPRRSPRKPTPTGPDSNSARTQPANWDDPGLPRRALVRLANSYKERGEGDIPEFPRRSPRKPTPTGPDSNSARTQPANWDDPGLPRRALVRLANSYKERGEGDIPEFPRRSPRKPTPTGPDSNSARTQPANWDDPGLPRRALVRLANSYKERGDAQRNGGAEVDQEELDAGLRQVLAEMVLPEHVEIELERVMEIVFQPED